MSEKMTVVLHKDGTPGLGKKLDMLASILRMRGHEAVVTNLDQSKRQYENFMDHADIVVSGERFIKTCEGKVPAENFIALKPGSKYSKMNSNALIRAMIKIARPTEIPQYIPECKQRG